MPRINYAKLYTLRKDGRYMGYWFDDAGKRHAVYDRDPEQLYRKIQGKQTSAAALTFNDILDAWVEKHWPTIRDGTQIS